MRELGILEIIKDKKKEACFLPFFIFLVIPMREIKEESSSEIDKTAIGCSILNGAICWGVFLRKRLKSTISSDAFFA